MTRKDAIGYGWKICRSAKTQATGDNLPRPEYLNEYDRHNYSFSMCPTMYRTPEGSLQTGKVKKSWSYFEAGFTYLFIYSLLFH